VEEPQADPVVAVISEYFQRGMRDPVVLERDALLLSLRQERDVSADRILLGEAHRWKNDH